MSAEIVFKRSAKGEELLAILKLIEKLRSAGTERQKRRLTLRIHAENEEFFRRWDEDAVILIQRAFS